MASSGSTGGGSPSRRDATTRPVELGVRPRLRLDGPDVVTGGQPSPPVGGLTTPGRIAGGRPIAERLLLDVEPELLVGGAQPEHPHPRSSDGGQDAHPEVAPHTVLVLERHERVVVDLGARPSTVDLGIDGQRGTEQPDRLIDQMAPEVEQEAAGFLGVSPFTPRSLADRRPPPFEPRLEPDDRPERVLGDEPAHREQIPVPPAVLEHGEEETSFRRGDPQAAALLGGRCHGFVDHDREPRLERGQSEGHVEPVRRGHDDQVVLGGPFPERLHIGQHDSVGVNAARARASFGIAGHDRRERHPRRR